MWLLYKLYQEYFISLDTIVADELTEYSNRLSITATFFNLKKSGIELADKEFIFPPEKQSLIEFSSGVDGFKKVGKLVLYL